MYQVPNCFIKSTVKLSRYIIHTYIHWRKSSNSSRTFENKLSRILAVLSICRYLLALSTRDYIFGSRGAAPSLRFFMALQSCFEKLKQEFCWHSIGNTKKSFFEKFAKCFYGHLVVGSRTTPGNWWWARQRMQKSLGRIYQTYDCAL